MTEAKDVGLLGTLIERVRIQLQAYATDRHIAGDFDQEAEANRNINELGALALPTAPPQQESLVMTAELMRWIDQRFARSTTTERDKALLNDLSQWIAKMQCVPPAPPQGQEQLQQIVKYLHDGEYRNREDWGSQGLDSAEVAIQWLLANRLAASPPAQAQEQEPEIDLSEVDCPHCNGIGKIIRAYKPAPAQAQEHDLDGGDLLARARELAKAHKAKAAIVEHPDGTMTLNESAIIALQAKEIRLLRDRCASLERLAAAPPAQGWPQDKESK